MGCLRVLFNLIWILAGGWVTALGFCRGHVLLRHDHRDPLRAASVQDGCGSTMGLDVTCHQSTKGSRSGNVANPR